jgi:hypothetical protein
LANSVPKQAENLMDTSKNSESSNPVPSEQSPPSRKYDSLEQTQVCRLVSTTTVLLRIIQYVKKDADIATRILNGFFICWPWSCWGKQVMILNELEEILELLGADQLFQVSTMLGRCLDSDHFQDVERALFLWNNEHLVKSGCLCWRLNAQAVLPQSPVQDGRQSEI